jgi:hypothetical protein
VEGRLFFGFDRGEEDEPGGVVGAFTADEDDFAGDEDFAVGDDQFAFAEEFDFEMVTALAKDFYLAFFAQLDPLQFFEGEGDLPAADLEVMFPFEDAVEFLFEFGVDLGEVGVIGVGFIGAPDELDVEFGVGRVWIGGLEGVGEEEEEKGSEEERFAWVKDSHCGDLLLESAWACKITS